MGWWKMWMMVWPPYTATDVSAAVPTGSSGTWIRDARRVRYGWVPRDGWTHIHPPSHTELCFEAREWILNAQTVP